MAKKSNNGKQKPRGAAGIETVDDTVDNVANGDAGSGTAADTVDSVANDDAATPSSPAEPTVAKLEGDTPAACLESFVGRHADDLQPYAEHLAYHATRRGVESQLVDAINEGEVKLSTTAKGAIRLTIGSGRGSYAFQSKTGEFDYSLVFDGFFDWCALRETRRNREADRAKEAEQFKVAVEKLTAESGVPGLRIKSEGLTATLTLAGIDSETLAKVVDGVRKSLGITAA